MRSVINLADEFSFGSDKDMHEMSSLYEDKIARMGNAGRNGGEYYTPRPLIRTMIRVTDPNIGESIYDGAVGSAGFLCEAHDYLKSKANSTDDLEILQKRTYYGKEKKGLAYVIGIMNMILHGIDAPNIIHTNTLNENVMDIQDKDRHSIVLANPPFGGKEKGGPAELPYTDRRDCLSVPAALHADAEARWSMCRRNQEHVPIELRQRLYLNQEGIA